MGAKGSVDHREEGQHPRKRRNHRGLAHKSLCREKERYLLHLYERFQIKRRKPENFESRLKSVYLSALFQINKNLYICDGEHEMEDLSSKMWCLNYEGRKTALTPRLSK